MDWADVIRKSVLNGMFCGVISYMFLRINADLTTFLIVLISLVAIMVNSMV